MVSNEEEVQQVVIRHMWVCLAHPFAAGGLRRYLCGLHLASDHRAYLFLVGAGRNQFVHLCHLYPSA